MSETSRWRPISGGARRSMFGLHREPGPERLGAVSCKLLVLLGVLASSALAVCFVSLVLTRTSFSELIEEPPQNKILQSTRAPLPPNVTGPGDGVQETLSRPGNDFPTVNYPPAENSQEDKSVSEDTIGIHRQPEQRSVRDYVENIRKGRIINRKRLPIDLVGTPYSQPPSYGDEYVQLEGYRSPPRGVHEVMSWVESPGVKFTGIYVKAEDKPFLNGHAYVSDPFVRFKPSHPSEINQLAVETERGTRFSNRPNPQSAPTHTQAIFHPMMRPRPLKIMLDVYPMIPEPSSGQSISGLTEYRGRPQKTANGPAPNRMIIHLNLFPKKTAQLRRRPGFSEEESVQERVDEENFDEENEETTSTTTEVVDLPVDTTTERTEN